jgi:protein TonB
VVQLPGIAPSARGVAVASGQPTTRRVGGGGTGKGRGGGSGDGVGSGSGPPVIATSVASIKKAAEAKEGFDYFDARKSYPADARRLGVEGKVRVRLLVDATGKVAQARLLGTRLGHGLDELALSRARAIEFEPALDTDDRPVASVVIWTFTFTLPSDT